VFEVCAETAIGGDGGPLVTNTRVSGLPKFTIGSMAITMPSRNFAP